MDLSRKRSKCTERETWEHTEVLRKERTIRDTLKHILPEKNVETPRNIAKMEKKLELTNG